MARTNDVHLSGFFTSAKLTFVAAFEFAPELVEFDPAAAVSGCLSTASLFALYSILFCSKFGSLRYSSRAPASDTGAYRDEFNKRQDRNEK